jgi:DNA-binding NarL/FixJ family response regulator
VTPLRIVLVGTPEARGRLRRQLGTLVEVVAEATTLAAGRAAAPDADAVLLARRSAHDTGDEPSPGAAEPLTPRERDVLQHLVLGRPNKTIAARLGISDQTVKVHVASIIAKLGAANRTDVVRRAISRGIIDV